MSNSEQPLNDLINKLGHISGEAGELSGHALLGKRSQGALTTITRILNKMVCRLETIKNQETKKPICHIGDCTNLADWKIWDKGDIYDLIFTCSDCVPELLIPGHSYTIEPWSVELSQKEKDLLLNEQAND